MTLTKQQIGAILRITTQVARWEIDGQMTFTIYGKRFDDGTVMVSGSNIHSDDHQWFMRALNINFFVSPRGRIRVGKHGAWRQWGAREVRLRADAFKTKAPRVAAKEQA